MPTFTEVFAAALSANGISRYSGLAPSFEKLAVMLRETNEKYNLTAITDDAGISYKHFADCLLAAGHFPANASVADVGCGGGFPCLPLALARPDLKITAIDSTAKKLGFIKEAADALGLSNIKTVCGRAEELGRTDLRESFDVVTARAVARLNILCEWCVPLVKKGGLFIALKGKDAKAELDEAGGALRVLGCTAELTEYTLLAPEEQERGIIIMKKNTATPGEYPRNGGKIKKKPL